MVTVLHHRKTAPSDFTPPDSPMGSRDSYSKRARSSGASRGWTLALLGLLAVVMLGAFAYPSLIDVHLLRSVRGGAAAAESATGGPILVSYSYFEKDTVQARYWGEMWSTRVVWRHQRTRIRGLLVAVGARRPHRVRRPLSPPATASPSTHARFSRLS